jgi:YHS domain-containing protein
MYACRKPSFAWLVALVIVPHWASAQPAARGLPLAAKGFCVVTLRDRREWRSGDPRIGAEFDGRQYRFAGERERDIFGADPTSYAPVLGGDCVVTFAESQRRVAGRFEFGVVHRGRIYFLASEEAKSRFIADPARFADADLADGGRCPVSRVERARIVAGLPETAVLRGGLRWLFAGGYERSLFLQQPVRYESGAAANNQASLAAETPVAGGDAHAETAATGNEPPTGLATGGSTRSDDGAQGADGQDMFLSSQPAMGGYCPVTIRRKGIWIRGRYDYRIEASKLMFLTAGPEERDAFTADPAVFIPALGGDCVVSLVDRGERVRGSVYHASQYQKRLFLFADAESKARFDAGPAPYASVDLAADGLCVVTLADEGSSTPGLVEFSVWHDGLLYRLAGPEEKARFLASPEKYAAPADEPPPSDAAAAAPGQPPQPLVAQ